MRGFAVTTILLGYFRCALQALQRFGMVLAIAAVSAPTGAAVSEKLPDGVFARVGGQEISFDEYHGFLAQRLRQKYFHGRLVHEEMARAQHEITQELIDQYLAAQEAQRRGLAVDPSNQNGAADGDPGQRATALREQVRAQVTVSEADVKNFYEQHPDKFTAPEQVRLSVILLVVPPYAPKEDWQAAYDQAVVLRQRIEDKGEAFATLAQENSKHESATRGGDLGFVHKGRLAPDVEEVVNNLSLGKVSEPVPLLQGVGLFRIEERKPPHLNPLADVMERARLLLVNERSEVTWQVLIEKLRQTTPITVAEGVP